MTLSPAPSAPLCPTPFSLYVFLPLDKDECDAFCAKEHGDDYECANAGDTAQCQCQSKVRAQKVACLEFLHQYLSPLPGVAPTTHYPALHMPPTTRETHVRNVLRARAHRHAQRLRWTCRLLSWSTSGAGSLDTDSTE